MSEHAGIVLFDGHCVFCDGLVRWMIARDPGARLRFAPLAGETAAALRERHAEIPVDDDTVVYVDAGETVFLRSDAALSVLALLETPLRHVAAPLGWLPRWLRDPPYRLFARVRYRVFGRFDSCPIPAPDVARRFLA